ncbi:DUF7352 domain-containing protein [Sphaerisporangium viridialbum]|uniref:DUF7352 domain-containing protein n=1 Tax=Sphaerisporangium viridialbum TaxID=46189 RepID=UPI003C74319E
MTAGVDFWVERHRGTPAVERTFQVFGTGQPIPATAIHRSTAARDPHGLVWHLYQLGPDRV